MTARITLVGATLLSMAALARAGEAESKVELQRLEGTWNARVLAVIGSPLSPEDQTKFRIKFVVKGDTYTVYMGDKEFCCGTVKVDPTQDPPTIDALATSGAQKGKTQPGIYKLNGDEMQVVFTEPGHPRPTEFSSRKGTQEIHLSYKRVSEAQASQR